MNRQTMLSALLAAGCLLGLGARPADAAGELNLYNWTIYINPEILSDFATETGIKVNLDNYGTNEEMLAKIQAGATGYDIVFPSVHMQDIMAHLKLLQPAGLKTLKGYDNIDQTYFLAKSDPEHDICLPYNRGTSGLSSTRNWSETPQSTPGRSCSIRPKLCAAKSPCLTMCGRRSARH